MAFRTPTIRDENFHIRIGKDADAFKTALLKPAKAGRKALKDLTNTGKHQGSGRGTVKHSVKSNFLTDEELKMCQEWAKEGIEVVHSTGNDIQKLQQETLEKRIKRNVMKDMSALHEWLNPSRELRMQKEELSEDAANLKMELEPEVLPSLTKPHSSGDKDIGNYLEHEADLLSFLERRPPLPELTILDSP